MKKDPLTDDSINPLHHLTTEEQIEEDEGYAALTHREALALNLSSVSKNLTHTLIRQHREKELLSFITPELLNKAYDILRTLPSDIRVVSIFDYPSYPETLEELCDEAPVVLFYNVSEGLENTAREYADSILNNIPMP